MSHALPRALLIALAPLLAACSEPGPRVEITEHRTASRPSSSVRPGAKAAERFGSMSMAPAGPERPIPEDLFHFELPDGWERLAANADRLVNLRPAGDPSAACYLTILQGSGGGLADNVNRWRKQLGAEPLAGEAIAALPKAEFFGRPATLVEVQGTFTGMGEAPRAGHALLGLVFTEPQGSLFLKFTGPAELVAREREAFLGLARSLTVAAHGPGDGHDHGGELDAAHADAAGTPPVAPRDGGLAWSAPPGWQEGPPRAMREVSFPLAEGAECYVTRLVGDGGGLRANLDRWSVQMGGKKLDDAGFAALARVRVLGQEVPLLDLAGSFTGMDGVEREQQGLLGVAVIRAGDSLFVKLTGPEAVVRGERANFLAFLASLVEG
jgi:hypothetical protein